MFTPLPTDSTALLQRIAALCRADGTSCYLVGGAIRNRLLGRPSADLDMAVQGDALALGQAMADALSGRYVVLHEERHVTRVIVGGADGEPVTIDITEIGENITENLLRRDFTINAMAVPLDDLRGANWDVSVGDSAKVSIGDSPGRGLAPIASPWRAHAIIDPAGGRADLATRTLRAVRPDVFREDPLRLLRAVRLAAELGFTIDSDTQAAARRDAPLLTIVAGERLREELCRIFAADDASGSVRLMDRLGLLEHLLPEVALGRGVGQPKEHHWDVLEHNIETVGWLEAILHRGGGTRPSIQTEEGSHGEGTATPPQLLRLRPLATASRLWRQDDRRAGDPLDLIPWALELEGYFDQMLAGGQRRSTLLKLAGLLHDVAKPQTKGPDATGRIRFLGHDELGGQVSAAILERLRFSAKETLAITTMVTHHLRPNQLAAGWELPTDRALYRYFRDVGDLALDTVYLNLADHLAARGPTLEWPEWQAHTTVAAHIVQRALAKHERPVPSRLLTGYDVMAHFGVGPGPQIGQMVEAALEAQASGEVSSRDEALRYLELWLAPQADALGAEPEDRGLRRSFRASAENL